MTYPGWLDLGSLWLGLRSGSVGPGSLRIVWILWPRLLLGIIRVLLWTRLLLLIFAVGVGVKVIRLGRAAAEKVRVKVRIVPEASGPLSSVRVRGGWRPGELPLTVLPLPPWRRRPPLLVIIRELTRLSLPPDLLRIPAEAKLPDVRETDLVEEAKILLRESVVHGIFGVKLITWRRPWSLTLWSVSLSLAMLKYCGH